MEFTKILTELFSSTSVNAENTRITPELSENDFVRASCGSDSYDNLNSLCEQYQFGIVKYFFSF